MVLNNLYQVEDFDVIFQQLRNMINGYLFNGTTQITLSKQDYMFGYTDTRLMTIFSDTSAQSGDEDGDYFYGMEVDMPEVFTPALVDDSSAAAM